MNSSEVSASSINYSVYFDNGYINFESPICMFISAIIWRCIYGIFRLFFSKQTPEFSSRALTFIHGFLSAFLGINQCFLVDSPFDHPEWKTNYVQSFILNMSFGYFVHDTLWQIKHDLNDWTMLFHHILCVCALISIIFKGYSGAQATCALGSMEITNPFLQARWFLRTAGMQSTAIFKSTEITFFLVFVFVRIIVGTYFLNIIVHQPKNDWEFILMSAGIYAVSWVFIWTMIKYIMRKYVGQRPIAEEEKEQ